MIELDGLKLADIMPDSLKNDADMLALADALDAELTRVTERIYDVVLLPNIDTLPENILDSLAWQFHVDFYEPLGLDTEKKRALVKNALIWHKRKGTKSALEELLNILFDDRCRVNEWFDYGGRPYFFKVFADDVPITQGNYETILRAVYELKNVRSWLESVVARHKLRQDVYAGGVWSRRKTFAVGFSHGQAVDNSAVYVALAMRVRRLSRAGFSCGQAVEDSTVFTGGVVSVRRVRGIFAERGSCGIENAVYARSVLSVRRLHNIKGGDA